MANKTKAGTVIERASERFSVSTEGMRELHEGRGKHVFIRELISNALDEMPHATKCEVTFRGTVDGNTEVLVSDDGRGFADYADAYRLMGASPKRADPNKRGRFNLGEKEFFAVALWGEVQTAGYTIRFTEDGGREVLTNDRRSGTTITALMPWSPQNTERLIEHLWLFRVPKDFTLVVNNHVIRGGEPIRVRSATLPTVIQHAPGEPLRPTRRKTDIEFYRPHKGHSAYLYEMGVPIQPIEADYDINVLQKVPLPPNRDTVRDSYLQDLYAETMNAMYDIMEQDEFSNDWVRTALGDDRIEEETVKSIVQNKYGDKTVLWSSDKAANMEALDAGYQVLHGRTMSPSEREAVRDKGGLKYSSEVFDNNKQGLKPADEAKLTQVHKDFAQWVKEVALIAGFNARVSFVDNPDSRMNACCTAASRSPSVIFNIGKIEKDWFGGRGASQLALVIHELGHAEADAALSHGPAWGEGCAVVGAKIARGLNAVPNVVSLEELN